MRHDLMKQRRRLVSLLLEEAKRCGLDDLVVASHNSEGRWSNWRRTRGAADYDYRAVLPSQVTFDVGDRGDWDRCRRTTHRLWTVLNRCEVPYWGSLTSGKGTHTTVFIRPHRTVNDEDMRPFFAWFVVKQVAEMEPIVDVINEGDLFELLDIDPVCAFPNVESRQLREFGARKRGSEHRKTLWVFGPGRFDFLPAERDEAYKYKDIVIPDALPVASRPPGAKHHEVSTALGKPCPQGAFCFPGPTRSGEQDQFPCRHCPVTF